MFRRLINFFKIPWHKQEAKASDVLKLIGLPLCSSLYITSVALNTLIFVSMNSKQFTDELVYVTYGASVSAVGSFVVYLLAIIYGNFVFIAMATIFQYFTSIGQGMICWYMWMLEDMGVQVDYEVFHAIRILLTIFVSFIAILDFRVLLISIVLGSSMYKRGCYWDIDENEGTWSYQYSKSIILQDDDKKK